MNQQQIMSVVRNLLQIAGTLLTTYGVVTQGQWEPIAGAVLMLTPIVWGVLGNTQAKTIASAAAMSGTSVSKDGRTLTIHDPELMLAAQEAATPFSK